MRQQPVFFAFACNRVSGRKHENQLRPGRGGTGSSPTPWHVCLQFRHGSTRAWGSPADDRPRRLSCQATPRLHFFVQASEQNAADRRLHCAKGPGGCDPSGSGKHNMSTTACGPAYASHKALGCAAANRRRPTCPLACSFEQRRLRAQPKPWRACAAVPERRPWSSPCIDTRRLAHLPESCTACSRQPRAGAFLSEPVGGKAVLPTTYRLRGRARRPLQDASHLWHTGRRSSYCPFGRQAAA